MKNENKNTPIQIKNNPTLNYQKFFKQRLTELKQVLKEFLPCCFK